MSINREIWKVPFRKDGLAVWKCPRCNIGMLVLDQKTLVHYETASSRSASHSEDWEPSWDSYSFTAAFRCNYKKCDEVITIVGTGQAEEFQDFDDDGNYNSEYEVVYFPRFFSQPMRIFSVPVTCPDTVSSEISKSFNIFFADSSAAANHIRNSVEELLTYFHVKRYDRIDRKLRGISLHRRIRFYEKSNKAVAERLLAIKRLGNAASHPGGLTQDDVLDAYEILESVLSALFDSKQRKLDRLVKNVNRLQGPLRRGKTA